VTLLGGPKQGFYPPAIAQHIRVLQQLDMLPQVNPKLGGCIIPFTTRHGYLVLLLSVTDRFPKVTSFCFSTGPYLYGFIMFHLRTPTHTTWKRMEHQMGTIWRPSKPFFHTCHFQTALILVLHPKKNAIVSHTSHYLIELLP
jgi:hypothetical protein